MRLFAVLLALPFAAQAELIYVDYDAIVSGFEHNDDSSYSLGQRLQGRLTIDTVLAGAPYDSNAVTAHYGVSWGDRDYIPDFVTGFLTPSGGEGTDQVDFYQDTPFEGGVFDGFAIADDLNFGRSGGIQFVVFAPDLLDGLGFDQSFAVKATELESGGSMRGTIVEAFESWVSLELRSLSMTPARCFAH
jgi:hypothetical protein